ncbi:MAG: tRNA (adenosine(37)-N6)-threonylcarbamoyltransferase complex dimerization subunit type 1 TsaB [Gemmatimonadaceae bacterium]
MITLALDASTYVGTVCVARGREILAARTVAMRDSRSERLMPAVAAALAEAAVSVGTVERVVCGAGPGSFTSLRIAAAIAKGMATATACPLYAVSSLALMVGAAEPQLGPGEYVATLDALRGEAYAATCVIAASGDVTEVGPVRLVSSNDLEGLERAGRPLVGDRRGVQALPDARGVVRVAALLERGGPAELHRWEPEYGRVAEAQRRWEAAHGRALPNA